MILNTLLHILRLLWFILKVTVVIVLVISLAIFAFFIARDSANVYVIITDGMKERADVLLQQEEFDELYKYYSQSYINHDASIKKEEYQGYLIRDYDYKLQVESLWCRPFQDSADVVVVESVTNIDGERPAQEDGQESIPPPEWPRRRYRVTCVQQENAWLIDSIEVIESLPPAATPTEQPEITPLPEGVTPAPTPVIT